MGRRPTPKDDADLRKHTADPRPSSHPANRRRPRTAERRPHFDWRKRLQRRLRAIATDGRVVCPPFDLRVDGSFGPKTWDAIDAFRLAYVGGGTHRYDLSGQAGDRDISKIKPGSRFWKALRWAAAHDRISPNFRLAEFACNDPANPEVRILRSAVLLAEDIRRERGSWSPVSAYRTPEHNKRVGGASASRHAFARLLMGKTYGDALDVPESLGLTIAGAVRCGAKGIGYDSSSLKVEHADCRESPAQWQYSD